MPDWTAPFRLPKLTNEKYARLKAEYVAKNGYTITIPGLSDIIKIKTEEPMSALENYWYKNKQWEKFTPDRLEEVRKQKKKRKERFQQMLASPTPAVFQNAGSIMTAIDDAQDAISTLGAIGSLAQVIAPRALKKLIAGPTGLLIATSDMLNMVQQIGMSCMMPMYGKRNAGQHARGGLKTKKLKMKKATWGRPRLPTHADWIQGLQTTEQVFGFGISLGPIVGLLQDIVFGSVRSRPGEFIKIKAPAPDLDHWHKVAQKAAKSQTLLWGIPHMTDEEEILSWTMSACLSFQACMDTLHIWNPLENVEEISTMELEAPRPTYTLTIEAIDEEGFSVDDVMGWPQTGTKWAPMHELLHPTHERAMWNLVDFAVRNKKSWVGFGGILCANEAAAYALASLEGESDVFYDFNADFKVCTSMIEQGIQLDPKQPLEKFHLFRDYLEDCDAANYNPSLKDVAAFCDAPWNNIKLQQTIRQP